MPDERPLVILAKVKSALRIAHADRRARALGLQPGLTLADARARVPDIAIADEDRTADQALLEHVADWCDRYTPLVALDGENGLMLDITGCAHLFGGEAELRGSVMTRLEKMGFTAVSAIAGTPDAARAVARFSKGGIVPPGEERALVCPLPILALGLDDERVTALARAGLRTIADLAERHRAPLSARFGADLIERLARTLGEQDHPISPRRPVPDLVAERRFAEPIARAEDITGTISALAEDLVPLLEARGTGGRRFEASVFRADGAVRRITVETGRPLRDTRVLAKLFAERLDALSDPIDPGFGFDMIRLAVLASEAALQTQTRFGDRDSNDEAVAELVDRLGARFGTGRILRFVPEDSHVPERMARAVPAISTARGGGEWLRAPAGETPAKPLRLFDPPEPVETLAEVPDGPPVRFRWRRVMHEIIAAEGPERIAPEWWRRDETELTRDYFRVEDTEGYRYWLYREGVYGTDARHPRWFLHGLFA